MEDRGDIDIGRGRVKMQIESLHIQNFRVFRDVRVENIPQMAVFMGQNGVGKTTFFDVFSFLHDCLDKNASAADRGYAV